MLSFNVLRVATITGFYVSSFHHISEHRRKLVSDQKEDYEDVLRHATLATLRFPLTTIEDCNVLFITLDLVVSDSLAPSQDSCP